MPPKVGVLNRAYLFILQPFSRQYIHYNNSFGTEIHNNIIVLEEGVNISLILRKELVTFFFLEEGIDFVKCNLVIMLDSPSTFNRYIYSKVRAIRAKLEKQKHKTIELKEEPSASIMPLKEKLSI